MTKFFNPLDEPVEVVNQISTSSLLNDVVGQCPKCKQAFGNALVGQDTIYYCEKCRVSQPIPL